MQQDHNFLRGEQSIIRNERKTALVVFLTAAMMVIELIFGYLTSSMALLADGWHMASHAGALLISFAAYRLARSPKLTHKFSFGAGKFIPLGGYTSAVVLALIALLMAEQSFERLLNPRVVHYDEALWVTSIGLLVNIVSAFVLGNGNNLLHQHSHSHAHPHAHSHETHESHESACPGHAHSHSSADSNLRSAFFHVLADALTSVLALIALFLGRRWDMPAMDAAMGIVGAVIILRWAYNLCRETAWELLDATVEQVSAQKVQEVIAKLDAGAVVKDLHVWKVAPNAQAAEVALQVKTLRGSAFYRAALQEQFSFAHLVIEESL